MYAQRLGMGVVGVVTAMALAVAAPMIINRRIDPFIHVTANASPHYEGYPSVEKIAEVAAGQEQSAADSDWKVSFGDVNVKQMRLLSLTPVSMVWTPRRGKPHGPSPPLI